MKSESEINRISEIAVSQFSYLEESLKEVLSHIPLVEKNKEAWSPRLIPIICETCNQIDSLWKFQAQQSPCVKQKKLDIIDYFQYFGEPVSKKQIIFWSYDTEIVIPFKQWRGIVK